MPAAWEEAPLIEDWEQAPLEEEQDNELSRGLLNPQSQRTPLPFGANAPWESPIAGGPVPFNVSAQVPSPPSLEERRAIGEAYEQSRGFGNPIRPRATLPPIEEDLAAANTPQSIAYNEEWGNSPIVNIPPGLITGIQDVNPVARLLKQIPAVKQFQEGAAESLAHAATGLTTPNAISQLPYYAVPVLGETLMLKGASDMAASGAGKASVAIQQGDPRLLGEAGSEFAQAALLGVPGAKGTAARFAPLTRPSVRGVVPPPIPETPLADLPVNRGEAPLTERPNAIEKIPTEEAVLGERAGTESQRATKEAKEEIGADSVQREAQKAEAAEVPKEVTPETADFTLTPVLETKGGKTYAGESHSDALNNAMKAHSLGEIAPNEIMKVLEAQTNDVQHKFLKKNADGTTEVLTREQVGELTGLGNNVQSEQLGAAGWLKHLKEQKATEPTVEPLKAEVPQQDFSKFEAESRKLKEQQANEVLEKGDLEFKGYQFGDKTKPLFNIPGTNRTAAPESLQAEGFNGPSKGKTFDQWIEEQSKGETSAETPSAAPLESGVPELIGMGGATPAEFQPPKPFKTSNKNAVVDAERKERGLEPMMELERQTNQAAWDEAMRIIDERPEAQDTLINELRDNPRAPTPIENAMLTHRRVDLRNEHEKALRNWRQAFEGNEMVRAGEEKLRVKEWSSKLSDFEDITKFAGAESGRSLQARKTMVNEDFSLSAMEVRAMEAKGRHLTSEEHIELIKAQEKITELNQKLDSLEAAREGKEVDKGTTDAMKDVSREAKRESKSKDFDIDREETLVSDIKAKMDKGQQNEITPLIQQLARVFWRRGIREREPMIDELHKTIQTIAPDFTRDATQRAFSGYGNFKPLSKGEIDVGLRDLKGQTQQVLKLEALEAKKPLEKTGQERRSPSDEERRLIKQVNELKRKYGVVVTDPATQLKSALESRKTYYEHRISDLKHEIETRQRIVKTKSDSPRDAELDAMIAEKDRLQEEHEQIFGKREITDEQRLNSAIAAAERNEAHWQTRLEKAQKGDFEGRTPGKKVTSAELEAIKARTEATKEHVQELKDLANPKATPEEIALQSLKTRMKNRTADYLDRLAKGDFAKKERKPVILDPAANKMKAELDLSKEAFDAGLEKDRWERSTVFDKSKTRAWGVYDLIKTVMTTGEFSFVLRQGKGAFLESLTSPKRAVIFTKAIRDGIRSMESPLKQRTIEQEIFSDPLYPQMLRDKLYVPEHGSKLSKQEEFMMGRYSDAIPGVQAFNRAGETFLKKLRADNYKAMIKSMTEGGTVTPEQGRIIAQFINEQTGRGGLGAAEPAAVALNRVFFSPRYLASRVQIASGHQLWSGIGSGKWDGTGRARKAVAGSYARMLIGGAMYYTALGTFFNRDDKKATVEGDFRSSDAGKLKIENTRLDPMAGIAQVMTMGQRTITGEAKDSSGKVFPIVGDEVPFGKDDWTEYATRFARSKVHPVIGGAIDLRMKKNMVGEDVTVTSKLSESGPMTYYDIYEALRAQDLSDGVALSLLGWLGEGLQTYEKKPKKK